jgi:hypothetical protein
MKNEKACCIDCILLRLAFAIAVYFPAICSGEPEASPAVRITEVPGFLVQRGKASVAVRITGLHSKWLEEGMTYERNTIEVIDVSLALVKIRDPQGVEYVLPLNINTIVGEVGVRAKSDAPKPAILLPHVAESEAQKSRRRETVIYDVYPKKGFKPRVDDLDWDWIKSDQNPMRERPTNPVDREFNKWPSMNQAEKDAFIELYRQCGFEVSVVTDNKGVGMVSHRLQPPAGDAGATENQKPSPKTPKT